MNDSDELFQAPDPNLDIMMCVNIVDDSILALVVVNISSRISYEWHDHYSLVHVFWLKITFVDEDKEPSKKAHKIIYIRLYL